MSFDEILDLTAGIFSFYNIQGGLRRGGLTPACGFAHARIGEESYDIRTGKAEAAQKRLFCQGVYFNSKERSYN